jgi:hypothetical protein
MNKATYVSAGKPLEFSEFEKNAAPMGWIRIDLLKNKIKNDSGFKNKFSPEELQEIDEVVE